MRQREAYYQQSSPGWTAAAPPAPVPLPRPLAVAPMAMNFPDEVQTQIRSLLHPHFHSQRHPAAE